jgi:hypothetical protein
MSYAFIPSLRSSAFLAAALAGLTAAIFACTSGGGGNLGDPCLSSNDCAQDNFSCLAVTDAGTCNTQKESDGAVAMTCQLNCTSNAQCETIGANFSCIPMSLCAGPDNMAICQAKAK